MAVKAIPQDLHTVTPDLIVKDAAGAIDFFVKVLGAKERARMPDQFANNRPGC